MTDQALYLSQLDKLESALRLAINLADKARHKLAHKEQRAELLTIAGFDEFVEARRIFEDLRVALPAKTVGGHGQD